MKKLILSAAIIAGLSFFAACNSDDNNDNNTNSRCVKCTTELSGQAEYTVCREDFDTQEQYDEAVEAAEAVGNCSSSS
jgi:hypothetical protein